MEIIDSPPTETLSMAIMDPHKCTNMGAGGGGGVRGCACAEPTARTVGMGCCTMGMGVASLYAGMLAGTGSNARMGKVGIATGSA